jgi:hypothetical protein
MSLVRVTSTDVEECGSASPAFRAGSTAETSHQHHYSVMTLSGNTSILGFKQRDKQSPMIESLARIV